MDETRGNRGRTLSRLDTMHLNLLSIVTASFFFHLSVFGQLDFLGFHPSDEENNDIWGYEDSLGNQYVLLGQNSKTLILDVTDPNNIIPLHSVPGIQSQWRDIKTWDSFAYIANDEGGGLDIIDLRFLPDSIHFDDETHVSHTDESIADCQLWMQDNFSKAISIEELTN